MRDNTAVALLVCCITKINERLTEKALLLLRLSPNPHLLQVNSGFGAFVSLKNSSFYSTSDNVKWVTHFGLSHPLFEWKYPVIRYSLPQSSFAIRW